MSDALGKVVVIGAGMGGLASAMRLATAGFDVTVLDRAETPGGKVRTLPSAAGPVDAGPTVLTMRHVFEDLFTDAGTTLNAHVTLERETVLARHWWPDGSTLDLLADAEASAAAVRAFGDARAEADFRAFSAAATQLFDAFEDPIIKAETPTLGALVAHVATRPAVMRAMAPLSSLAGNLARRFRDPRLRQLFGRYATYVGGSPYRSPAVLGLIWHSEASGVWRVRGGMHRLATAMQSVAENQGARFRFGMGVTRIETQSGRVAAVQLDDGSRLPCSHVVFNGDPRALSTGHLGGAVRNAVTAEGTEPRSLSANVWAFAARYTGPELAHHNVFFGADPKTEFSPIEAGHLPEDPTLYICAQDRGGATTPPETERFEIIMNAPPLPGGQPEDIDACRIRTFPTLARHGVRFSPEPADRTLTTPKGFDALFPASQGSLYGRSPHGMMAAFQRPTARTALPGLYLAGGGAHPGAGVPMATLSGRHAAAAILTDLASTSTSPRTAMRGGMSTGSAIAGPAPSRSSPS
ncbi:MAG: phytoene desaturase [Rhodobacteraceae bacterium]|nr:phytoene desaturase [Paracoccaceae bacterium]